MNERIRKLARQSGLIQYDTDSKLVEVEKFAELIVQECANIARTKSDALIEKGLKYAEDQDEEISVKATAWQLLVLEQEIKQHFGLDK